jgi:hypothetical protein
LIVRFCIISFETSIAVALLLRLNEADKAEAKKAREEKEQETKRLGLGTVLKGFGLQLAKARFQKNQVGAKKSDLVVAKQEAQAAEAEAAATASAGEGSTGNGPPAAGTGTEAPAPAGPGATALGPVASGVQEVMNGSAAVGVGAGGGGTAGGAGPDASPFMLQHSIKSEQLDVDMPDADRPAALAAVDGGDGLVNGVIGGAGPSGVLGASGTSSQLMPSGTVAGGEGPSGLLMDESGRRTFQEQLVSIRLPQGAAGGAAAGVSGYGDGKQVLDVRDLMEVMSRDPLYCKSEQLYRLYATAWLPK